MTVPPQIALRARCSEASDLSGIIFEMRVIAGTKNPYRIYFPKTAADGSTHLSAEDIEGQFNDHQEMALMDYNGNLRDASDMVTIRLFDPAPTRQRYTELLLWPLFPHERTQWESRQQLLDHMLSCRNADFTFDCVTTGLSENRVIYLPLHRAAVDTSDLTRR
jgi:hypothetical protein